ncbi:hybrid sensor histidine kinase/response regulator transcription factor [Confluentibacter flavum]|uniref:histidine kinase n=1 Tax=Confluentibacter flavum TaxID=1909700 RepID=A0A2N3HKJ7_9FLAO|nr:substrate-binding domain-containing protein [Confluentibacter flavum]PKQ45388.1 hypothetical protein CSW08_08475 [Confluentibacter flavum]
MKTRFSVLVFLCSHLVCLFNSFISFSQYKVGFSQCSTTHEWRKDQIKQMQIESALYPDIELIIKDAKNSSDNQITQIESLINEGVDLLIVSANESKALTPIIEKVYKRGIPVILLERYIESNYYTSYIGSNNYKIGTEAAKYASKLLNGKGEVIEITGLLETWPAKERQKGFKEEISNYPEIRIKKSIEGEWSFSKSEREISNIINSNVSFDLIYAHNDLMALGAVNSLKELKVQNRPFVIGIDGLNGEFGGIQAVLDKNIDATFLYPTGSELALQIADKILKGEPVKRQNILETIVIDSTNAKIVKLLSGQIESFQQNLEEQSSKLNFQISKQQSQQVVLMLTIACLFLIVVIIYVIYRNFQNKVNANLNLITINKEIENQNIQITKKNDELIYFGNQLEQTLNTKLSFFTIVSHEFKTPLTLIKGPLENLMEKQVFSKHEQFILKLIYRNILKLLHLVNQLMDFRKIERKKLELYLSKVNFFNFFKDVINSFSLILKQSNISITLECQNENIEGYLDVEKIQKAIYSILMDIQIRTPDFGKIYIKISEINLSSNQSNNQEVLIEIVDTNTGLTQEKLDTIFDAFNENVRFGDYFKTVLGLNLTKEFVEMHGGRILVENEKGFGVKFSLYLPVNKDSNFIERKEKEYNPIEPSELLIDYQKDFHIVNFQEIRTPLINTQGGSSLPVILVVEDIADIRDFIRISLGNKYVFLEANNGVEAIEVIKDREPDLIISDVMMPNMNGLELVHLLKSDIKTCHIPIILLTAWGELEHKLEGLDYGADAYLPKPFNSKLLQIRIAKLLELRLKLINHYHSISDNQMDIEESGLNKMDKVFLLKIGRIIESSIDNENFNVEELSNKMGMSRTYIYRKIKKMTDMSISEFIIATRLKKSLELLRNSGKSISEIAYDVGFKTPSYYTRCFKNIFKITPSEYIERNK